MISHKRGDFSTTLLCNLNPLISSESPCLSESLPTLGMITLLIFVSSGYQAASHHVAMHVALMAGEVGHLPMCSLTIHSPSELVDLLCSTSKSPDLYLKGLSPGTHVDNILTSIWFFHDCHLLPGAVLRRSSFRAQLKS